MLILFDIDGTLLHGKGIGRAATRDAMLEVFGTCATIDMHRFGGKTDWFTLVELLSPEGITADEIAEKMPVYEACIARHMAKLARNGAVEALPGALEAVNTLRRRDDVLLGLVTGNVAATAPIKLRAAGFDPPWFPVGAYGSEAIERNDLPPIALQRAIQYAKRHFDPPQVTIIGDTVADIECARALGARVISVLTGFDPPEAIKNARPDVIIDDLTTLLDVL